MRLRCKVKTPQGWKDERPDDVSKWLWRHDGQEAVAICDATSTYYCSLPSMVESYREAWERERRMGDKRRAAAFYELDKLLYEKETVK